MEKFDYKKKFKDLYMPSDEPIIVNVPRMNFIAVSGRGDPNQLEGDYTNAMRIIYGISFTIKMSKKSGDMPSGYYDYVVPPLEGLWDVDLSEISINGINNKEKFSWISLIRLPEYVTEKVFQWAKDKLKKKNPEIDFSSTKYLSFEEGLCVQVMHKGSYDSELSTIRKMTRFANENGYVEDFDIKRYRYHHEIYLNDPRKTKPDGLRTVIRHPIRKK